MSRRQSYHENQNAYLEVMRKAFENHYAIGTDVWSQDDSLTEAARLSLKEWQGRNRKGKPHMLDVGCGNARVFQMLHSDITSYTGVDLCEHSAWKEIQAEADSPATFAVGDFLKWSLDQETGCFDLVLDHGCLHHQHPNIQIDCFRALTQLLAPGGVLSLVVWAESWKQEDIGEDGRFHLPFSLDQIIHMVAEAGLQLVLAAKTKARVGTEQYHAIVYKPIVR